MFASHDQLPLYEVIKSPFGARSPHKSYQQIALSQAQEPTRWLLIRRPFSFWFGCLLSGRYTDLELAQNFHTFTVSERQQLRELLQTNMTNLADAVFRVNLQVSACRLNFIQTRLHVSRPLLEVLLSRRSDSAPTETLWEWPGGRCQAEEWLPWLKKDLGLEQLRVKFLGFPQEAHLPGQCLRLVRLELPWSLNLKGGGFFDKLTIRKRRWFSSPPANFNGAALPWEVSL